MARDLMDGTYYKSASTKGKIPIKWTAPEALLYKKYSIASDVWSYAMILYEIWSVGKKPFQELSNRDVVSRLQTYQCLNPPSGCPREIYTIMVHCWLVSNISDIGTAGIWGAGAHPDCLPYVLRNRVWNLRL